MEFEVGTDFYIDFMFNRDISDYTVKIEYKNGSGVYADRNPSSVTANMVRYEVSHSINDTLGVWQFKVVLTKDGKIYKTNIKRIVVIPAWE